MKKSFLSISLVLCTILATATPFITRWDLTKSGSGANQISFNDTITGTVNYTWETIPLSSNTGTGTLTNGTTTISGLPTNAIIRLKIDSANFNVFNIGATDYRRLVDVEQWGTVKWTSMKNAFSYSYNLNISAIDLPNLSNVSDMSYMFAYCTNLNGPSNMNTWNTSMVINMSVMFQSATSFNQPIGNWNTTNVTNMSYMFQFATSFNQPLGNWNTSKVTDMTAMFINATSFNQPIGNWNTSNVIYMGYMFYKTTSFNQPIGNWNLSQCTNIYKMLDSSAMDCHNYAATLHGWANNSATRHNLHLSAANIHYGTNVVADRNTLINTKGWSFFGDIADANACYPTGITSTTPINLFTLSPNPTQGTLNINCSQAGTFTLYNMLGQAVYSTTLLGNNTKETKTLPSLPAALYNYILTSQNGERVVGKLEVE